LSFDVFDGHVTLRLQDRIELAFGCNIGGSPIIYRQEIKYS